MTIFISIDDNEQANLKKLCDEIFGEQNFVSNVIWERAFAPKNDAKYFSDSHDFLLVYTKRISNFSIKKLQRTEVANSRYKNLDNDPRGPWTSDNLTVKTYSAKYDYEIRTPAGSIVKPTNGRCWFTSKERMQDLVDDNRIWFGKSGSNVPRLKRFLSEVQSGMVPISIWPYKEVGHNQEGRQELKKLFDGQGFFDGPKPIRLLKRILHISNMENNSIVLDFFAGSATTAHACMEANAEDGKNRRFIMVQLDEPTDVKSAVYQAGYKTIASLSKDRIRRAGDLILEENKDKEGIENLDIGFKAFKLDSSNIVAWDPDPANLDKNLLELEVIKEGRTSEDVLYEILLRYGIDLSTPILEKIIDGRKVFSVGYGLLFVCMEDRIDRKIAEGIISWVEELNEVVETEDEPLFDQIKVVFKDSGFGQDEVEKTKTYQLLVSKGIRDVKCI